MIKKKCMTCGTLHSLDHATECIVCDENYWGITCDKHQKLKLNRNSSCPECKVEEEASKRVSKTIEKKSVNETAKKAAIKKAGDMAAKEAAKKALKNGATREAAKKAAKAASFRRTSAITPFVYPRKVARNLSFAGLLRFLRAVLTATVSVPKPYLQPRCEFLSCDPAVD